MNTISIQKLIKKSFFALVFAFLSTVTVQAQRIAYVDVNQILESMDEYRTAQDKLDKVAAKWRQEISEAYDEIKGLYSRYQAESVLMSEEVRRQKEEEIMNKEKEVREMQKSKFGPEGALFKKRQELVRPIQDKVFKAIEDYANTKGFDFIFDKAGSSGMIFSNPKYDKTNEILEKIKSE